jgi:hypothetical protein
MIGKAGGKHALELNDPASGKPVCLRWLITSIGRTSTVSVLSILIMAEYR